MNSPQRCLLLLAASLLFAPQSQAQDPTDAILDQTLASIQARQPALERLLLSKRIGEDLQGYVQALPDLVPELTPAEQKAIDDENKDRRAAYTALATLSPGKTEKDMAKEHVATYHKRYSKGIFRQEDDGSGNPKWSDGMTDAEHIADFNLKLVLSPTAPVTAGEPFDIQAQWLDPNGKVVIDPLLEGKQITLTAANPTLQLSAPPTTVSQGLVKWPKLRIINPASKVLLTVTCEGLLAGKTVAIPEFDVIEKQPDATDIRAKLPSFQKRIRAAQLLGIGPRRDADLNLITSQLEQFITAADIMKDSALKQELELILKTVTAPIVPNGQ